MSAHPIDDRETITRRWAPWRIVSGEFVPNANWRLPIDKWDRAACDSGVIIDVVVSCDLFDVHPGIAASGARAAFFGLVAATPRLNWFARTAHRDRALRYFGRRESMWDAARAYVDLVHGIGSEQSLGDGIAWPPRNMDLRGIATEGGDA